MFNRLEMDIFEWYKVKYPASTLANQLTTAHFSNRRWTGVGFYLDFKVDKNMPKLDMKEYGGHFPINGPGIESDAIHNNGGCLLWGKDGYVDCLEMYAFGDYFKEEVKVYRLVSLSKAG